MLIDGEKYACESCVRGHRVSACQHAERPLQHINRKGRPVNQCTHCRSLRKSRASHVSCGCGAKPSSKQQEDAQLLQNVRDAYDGIQDWLGQGQILDDTYSAAFTPPPAAPPNAKENTAYNGCRCGQGERCICAAKRDHTLGAVPEMYVPDIPPFRRNERSSKIQKPRLTKARSEETPSLTTFANGHPRLRGYLQNDMSPRTSVPHRLPIPHSVSGNADLRLAHSTFGQTSPSLIARRRAAGRDRQRARLNSISQPDLRLFIANPSSVSSPTSSPARKRESLPPADFSYPLTPEDVCFSGSPIYSPQVHDHSRPLSSASSTGSSVFDWHIPAVDYAVTSTYDQIQSSGHSTPSPSFLDSNIDTTPSSPSRSSMADGDELFRYADTLSRLDSDPPRSSPSVASLSRRQATPLCTQTHPGEAIFIRSQSAFTDPDISCHVNSAYNSHSAVDTISETSGGYSTQFSRPQSLYNESYDQPLMTPASSTSPQTDPSGVSPTKSIHDDSASNVYHSLTLDGAAEAFTPDAMDSNLHDILSTNEMGDQNTMEGSLSSYAGDAASIDDFRGDSPAHFHRPTTRARPHSDLGIFLPRRPSTASPTALYDQSSNSKMLETYHLTVHDAQLRAHPSHPAQLHKPSHSTSSSQYSEQLGILGSGKHIQYDDLISTIGLQPGHDSTSNVPILDPSYQGIVTDGIQSDGDICPGTTWDDDHGPHALTQPLPYHEVEGTAW